MKEDRQLLAVAHLSQLVTLVLGFGSLLLPLFIWITKKEDTYLMDRHGKHIINFQLSLIVNCIICVPLILFFGLGIFGFVILGVISIIFPIINAVRASNGEDPEYPLSYNFIS